jgi:hypothetical protein
MQKNRSDELHCAKRAGGARYHARRAQNILSKMAAALGLKFTDTRDLAQSVVADDDQLDHRDDDADERAG